MSLDDLPLDRPADPAPPPPPRSATASAARWIVVGLGGVAAGALLTFWWMSRAQPTPTLPAPTTATDVAVGANRPKRQSIDLPSLDQSDTWLRDLVGALSAHPTLARFLATPAVIRGSTLAIVQIGDGKTPSVPLKALQPGSRIMLQTGTNRIDPASYARWDGATAALTSIEPAAAAQLYVNIKPLLDQAYQELGHAGGDFDEAVVRAIETLADTPVAADPAVVRRPNYVEHEDGTLRALPPVQKQFLLIGPANQKKILTWLRQIAASLELKVQSSR
jgi:hypothetical protein